MSTPEVANAERFKEQVRQDWTAGVGAWKKWNPQFVVQTRAATDVIVQAAQITPGMQVLDLASGTGEPALTLAGAVGPEGHVTATDLVPEMLAVAAEHARQRGLTNLTFQQADAEALPFAPQTFDVVTCRFGIMFCPNARQALGEIRRVLKPGGRAAFVVWGPFDRNPYFTSTAGVFMKYVSLPPPPPGTPTPFTFAQPGTLSAALHTAGFTQVQEETRTISWGFPGSTAQCWEFIREVTAPAFRRFFEALAPGQHEQVISEVLDAIRQYDDGQQVNLPAVIVVATGVC
jgi:ubiquinone/menaquinone biosynthesis C-methylase UbiE